MSTKTEYEQEVEIKKFRDKLNREKEMERENEELRNKVSELEDEISNINDEENIYFKISILTITFVIALKTIML